MKVCKFGCGFEYSTKASRGAMNMHEKFCAHNPANKKGGEKVGNDDYDECVECGYEKVPTKSAFCPNCGVELDE